MFFFQLINSSQYIFALKYSLPPSFVIGLKKKRNISFKIFPQVKAFIIKSLSNILRTACHLLRYPQLQSDEQRITLPFHRHAKRVRISTSVLVISLPFHNIWQLHHVRCTRFQPCWKIKDIGRSKRPKKSQVWILWESCLRRLMRHWQLIRSKLGFYFSSGITLDIDVIFLWRTSYWSIEDKTYKKVERNPF